jgi:hypothetical protein
MTDIVNRRKLAVEELRAKLGKLCLSGEHPEIWRILDDMMDLLEELLETEK